MPTPTTTVGISIREETLTAVEEARGYENRSSFIRRCIKEKLKRDHADDFSWELPQEGA
jgi:metal-responsive CopG/Arc/MetJ family transcriptional regulator